MPSASVLPPGNTAQMAEWIGQRVGGDLFSIVVTEPICQVRPLCHSVRMVQEGLQAASGILRLPSLIQWKYWSRLVFIEQTFLRQKRQLMSGWIISALPIDL